MLTQRHQIPRIVTATEDFRYDVVDGAIISGSGFAAVGAETFAFLPNFAGSVLF